jgi:hypothetical protein
MQDERANYMEARKRYRTESVEARKITSVRMGKLIIESRVQRSTQEHEREERQTYMRICMHESKANKTTPRATNKQQHSEDPTMSSSYFEHVSKTTRPSCLTTSSRLSTSLPSTRTLHQQPGRSTRLLVRTTRP